MPASTPTSSTPTSSTSSEATTLETSVAGSTPVASEAVPATTEMPQQEDEEVFQTVTVEATITTSETVTESLAKAPPTISQTQGGNGTVLPRMRRVRRAL